MELMTKELEKQFPKLYATENMKLEDVKVIAKFFCPWNEWAWYFTEYDPETRIFFGFVRGLENEFGYTSLDEMEAIKGPFGLGIERDLYFAPLSLAEAVEKPV